VIFEPLLPVRRPDSKCYSGFVETKRKRPPPRSSDSNLGLGDPSKLSRSSPRLDFEQASSIV
jgi:hypothetical protein